MTDAHGPKVKVGIVFDDGFRESSLKAADIFERAGFRAVFAVLAEPRGFAPGFDVGDFGLWNELVARGHVVYPHGWTHLNLADMPFDRATGEIERCLNRFAEELTGFDERQAVWNYAYNSGTPELDRHLLTRVRAIRGNGNGLLSPGELASGQWHSRTFGPADPGKDLAKHLALCRQRKPPAFIYSLHGLDGVAWGAIPSDTLRRVLETLRDDPDLEYWTI